MAIRGNFDDAQTGVKKMFGDAALAADLDRAGFQFSSANSINIGRLVPQVAYYVYAYAKLVKQGEIAAGDRINVTVPTGNFGNILACYYARKMVLPVGKLICASNRNDVLTEFIRTGVYDRNRPFHTTMSPSMDILISSNLERLLFDLSGGDDALVRSYMEQLQKTGRYEVGGELLAKLQGLFYGGCCGEEDTSATIAALWQDGYLVDTHTAVAAKVLADYRRETGDERPAVFASTASPYKFCDSVLAAIGEEPVSDSVDRIAQLQEVSGVPATSRLAALKGKTPRFDGVADREEMEQVVLDFLK